MCIRDRFTQIDLEMSFVDEKDVRFIVEKLLTKVFKEVINIELKEFPILSYHDAIEKYGTDKPDLRFGITIEDFKPFSNKSDFKAFSDCDSVRIISVPNSEFFTRKIIDELDSYAQSLGAKGLAWFKVNNNEFSGGISKFFDSNLTKEIIDSLKLEDNSICFMIGDKLNTSLHVLGKIRSKLGDLLELKDNSIFSPVWIVDFPLFMWNEETKRYDSVNHPFTAPKDSDLSDVTSNPSEVISKGYDIVINGYEVAGGSIRIHDHSLQKDIFKIMDLSDEEISEKFEFEATKLAKKLDKILIKIDNGEPITNRETKNKRVYEVNSRAIGIFLSNLDAIISIEATCNNLIPLYKRNFEENKLNSIWLKRAASRMDGKDCSDDPFFVTLVEALHNIEPSADSAYYFCLLYTSPSPRDRQKSRMPSSA